MFFKNGMFFKIANFIIMFTFFQNLYFFQNRKIFLIFLHIFKIFSCKRIRSKNLFYFLNIEVLFWPPASAKIIYLPVCLSVCPSAKVFAITSSDKVVSLLITMVPSELRQNVSFGRYKYFLTKNRDVTKRHENRIVGAPGHGQSNATIFWSRRRVAREFSRDN